MKRSLREIKGLGALIAALSVFVLSEIANAVALGYMTGNEYLKLSERERIYWFVGVIDGIAAEQIFTPKNSPGPKNGDGKDDPSDRIWISECISRFPIEQLHAIFEKELKDTPESWHAPAALVARDKFEKMCGKGKK